MGKIGQEKKPLKIEKLMNFNRKRKNKIFHENILPLSYEQLKIKIFPLKMRVFKQFSQNIFETTTFDEKLLEKLVRNCTEQN